MHHRTGASGRNEMWKMGHGDGQAECRYPLQIRHTETRRDPISKPNPRAFQTSAGNKERRPDWLADDAVSCKLVSSTKFPANREINREFCEIRPSTTIFVSVQRADSIAYDRIP